jgi:diadenylate cyclase
LAVETTASAYYLKSYLSGFTTSFSELSVSIQHLSERRHGALIVIQRTDPLDAFIKEGVSMGASVSSSLLESIFYPGNPLHDGAALIQNNTIHSAANILPLSYHPMKNKIGTRHRAALGLSEKTDALNIVVSEETGKASFALDGTLYPISNF